LPLSPKTQTIGWFTATCLLVSNIIGGGIFTTTGLMARDLGDPLLILSLWMIGALFAIGGALVYGELGSRFPQAGGDYVYLREAYGPFIAFLSGWTSFTIGFGGAVAASAISFSSYALRVVPLDGHQRWAEKILSLCLLWTMTLIHCRGLGTGGRTQRLLTSANILAIGGLIIGGLFASSAHWDYLLARSSDVQQTLGAASTGLVIVIYCYLGWNVAGFIANEIANPQRTLPKILLSGTIFVALIYVLLNVVYLSALSIGALAQEPIVPVAEKAAAALWGPESGRVMAMFLCLAIAGAVSAMTWAGPRVYWAMAQDGVISPWLAQLHPHTGVPARAIVFQSLWASSLIVSGTFEQLLVYSGLVLAFFMALTLSTVLVLPSHNANGEASYRAPFYPILPALLVGGALFIVFTTLIEQPVEALYGAATVLSGIPLYLFWKRGRKESSSQQTASPN
jgi:APA family basic amino acid/polyamine antiporter